MRRSAVFLGGLVGGLVAGLWVAAPASAFAHDRVSNPFLHSLLDVFSLAVVTAPLWTAYLWGVRRRSLLLALIVVVQVPVAVIAFVPIVQPVVHVVSMISALALTVASLVYVRRLAAGAEWAAGVRPRRAR
jgi:hypothetical protein